MVNWKDICKPKKVRGLGVRDLSLCNQIAVGKIAWHIYMMKDSLWMRWVRGIYTKGGNWELFNAPITTSWAMKKLCYIKDLLKQWIFCSSYLIKKVYFDHFADVPKVRWRFLVWNNLSILKA